MVCKMLKKLCGSKPTPRELEVQINNFELNERSLHNLEGVHPHLVAVVTHALNISEVYFIVIEGLRNEGRQRELVDAGASKTMNSRHLTGHAVDLAAVVGGKISWDWPLYEKIAFAMKEAAKDLDVNVKWGGDWETLKDGPHWQLSWSEYPVDSNSGEVKKI